MKKFKLGQTKERKSALTKGLRIVMTKSEDVGGDQAEEAGSAVGPEPGWGRQ